MRRLAILAIVVGCGATGVSGAAAAAGPQASADELNRAAFLPNANARPSDPVAGLLDREVYAPGQGLMSWNSREVPLSGSGDGPINTLRIREGDLLAGPGELPLTQRAGVADRAYEVSLMRNWKSALNFDAGRLNIDLTPHAGLGVIGGDRAAGSTAEAGAAVELSKADLAGRRLEQMGVRDGASFGQQGRWYLFAAASGRAVGLNMLHGDSGWNRAGWSTDPTSKLVGDTQVGVGWRRGSIQTSVGYVHREVKGQHLMYGVDPKSDSMVAFSLSIRPRK